jgi:ribonuclease P/MRP protein subunit POP1
VICVQRTNGLSRGFGAGWDIILPSGWGMPFWISLLYANGGRAAGQRELRFFALEAGLPIFPEDYQDTIPGRTAMAAAEAERRASHERRPKSKRVDFDKYRISSPFNADLPSLFAQNPGVPTPSRVVVSTEPEPQKSPDLVEKQATGDKPRVRVLRSKSVVREALAIGTYATDESSQLQHSREDRSKKGSKRRTDGPSPPQTRWTPIEPLSSHKDESISPRVMIEAAYDNCLFQGTLRPCSKGTPLQNAIISALNPEDIDHWKKSCREYSGPVEALARKSDIRSGVVCASRKVIGRVVSGDYSLVRGCGVGRCVITVPAVLELLRAGACPSWRKGATRVDRTTRREEFVQIQVLYRNIRSLQYRPAIATIRI